MSQTKAQLIDTLVASLLPASDSAVDIGSNAVRFANIYGDTLYGNGANLTGINTDLVSDTSPQLGGNLDVNTKNILFGDSASASDDRLILGAGSDLQIYHDGSHSYINNTTGNLNIYADTLQGRTSNDEYTFKAIANGAVELYYDNSKKFETTSGGVGVSGFLDIPSDSSRLRLGASNDLQIYHNGTINYIEAVNGDLQLIGNSSEKFAVFAQNGAVELYHNNVKKFETASFGVRINDSFYVDEHILIDNDTGRIKLGIGADLQIYHDGSHSYINNTGTGHLYIIDAGIVKIQSESFKVDNADGSEQVIKANPNAGVEIYYDNSKKFETTSAGATVTGDLSVTANIDLADSTGGSNNRITLGTGDDLQLYHDGSNGTLYNSGSGNLTLVGNGNNRIQIRADINKNSITCNADGNVELYYDNSKKLETTSNGVQVTGALNVTTTMHIPDGSVGLQIGSSNDLRIYHDGNNSAINETGTGSLYIQGSNNIYLRDYDTAENHIVMTKDGSVDLYHNGSKKFETTSTGLKSESSSNLNIHLLKTGAQDTLIQNTGQTEICAATGGASGQRIVFRIGANTGSMPEIARFTPDGLCFGSDTAAANALDDYEEGTWTPGGSWTTISAEYIKIGRMVYAGFSIRANATSGTAQITGLPFTAANQKSAMGGIAWGLCEVNIEDGWINGFVDENTTTGFLKRNGGNNLDFGSGNNNMNNSAFIRGTFIYYAAS